MQLKLIETIQSTRQGGKTFEIFKSRGDFTGTNLFYVKLPSSDKGEWFRTQTDAHKWLIGGFERDPFTGGVYKPFVAQVSKPEPNDIGV